MTTRHAGTAQGVGNHAAHGKGNPAPEANMAQDAINIGMNIFRKGIAGYEQKEQQLLEWLWGYTMDELGGSKNALQKKLEIDYETVRLAWIGKLEAVGALCEEIERLKYRTVNSVRVVDTIVTRRITEALDYAKTLSSMVTVTGPTGRGKTLTAQHWARENNHGRAKYVRVPSDCNRMTLVRELCKKCGIGTNGKNRGDLEARLRSAFGSHNVIIADEAGHLMPRAGMTSALELLRDLHDMCGCSVVLIFTDVYLSELKYGRMRNYFEQFRGRIKFTVEIPEKVIFEEVEAVVKAFNPEAPLELVKYAHQAAEDRDGKLRTLFEDLDRAQGFARRKGRDRIALSDLEIAIEWRKSGGVWPD
ncbi:MAG: AAA family ATPase [Kiritimatiellae bacterium]|nr:AAA family ATPase [Kiritimatiellia bacterium]